MKTTRAVVAAGLILLFAVSLFSREPLNFDERVKAQEAIERVYYSHRIWPKENPQPKPPFEKMVTREQIEAKVTDYLKKSAALEQFWYRPIEGKQLQAEMERMAKGTKDPATLNELFKALNDDPYLIAECLARPVLADRLVRNWHANDERFHKETREKAKEALKHLTPENFCGYPEGRYSKATYRLKIEGRDEINRPDVEDHAVKLSEKEFAKMFAEIPEKGEISGVIEKDDCFVIVHTVEKNEGEMVVEGITLKKRSVEEWIKDRKEMELDPETAGITAMSLPPVKESGCFEGWDNGILDDVPPTARNSFTAIWTGTEMIVWGGIGYSDENTGGRYNPTTDTWSPTSTWGDCPSQRSSHVAVWTGTDMIIWGGAYHDASTHNLNTGAKYAPGTDSWTVISSGTNVPSPRRYHSAVWSGEEMIVWGGAPLTNTGGRYNPGTDTWMATSVGSNVPSPRAFSSAIWTGTSMIVWGGDGAGGTILNTGGRYYPGSDAWLPTSTAVNCPSPRSGHSAVWTDSEMIIWGGGDGEGPLNTGGKYNPVNDTWTATSTGNNAPSARYCHSGIWTGEEMIIWGGTSSTCTNTGAIYHPSLNSWTTMSNGNNTPSPRSVHSAIWTDSEMIVWGGSDDSMGSLQTGGRYSPQTDSWAPTSMGKGTPQARSWHTAVWTGNEMIVWGGYNESGRLNDGGRYFPAMDVWMSTSLGTACPEKRAFHTAVWTGSKVIVWGGDNGDALLMTGGKYDPLSDSWQSTSVNMSTPIQRENHSVVWSGTEMIIWGGWNWSEILNTGGRYNPEQDEWNPTSQGANTPLARDYHTAVWTGNEMIIWGGLNQMKLDSGGRYNPFTDSWASVSMTDAPMPRTYHTAVWTSTEMIVWGGSNDLDLSTGGKYSPSSDAWTPTSPGGGILEPRIWHAAIWNGTEMIIWGGSSNAVSLNTGSKYNPISDSWAQIEAMQSRPRKRVGHTAIWTGSSMIIFGGSDGYCLQSGGTYIMNGLVTRPLISGPSANTCPTPSVSLSIPASYVSYQWNLDGSPIMGANSDSYAAAASGSYTVSVTDSNGCSGTSDPHVVTITPCIPDIVYSTHGSFTQVTGDGDAYFEKGELWSVPVTVTNAGNTPASNVTAQLTGNGITVCNSPGSFGTIAAGGAASFTFQFLIDPSFSPCGGSINFGLGNKACLELTPAGSDEPGLFSVQVGNISAGVPTDLAIQPSSSDSYVSQSATGSNYGTATSMYAQARTAQARRSLVSFDLSAIPANSTINSATLELYATAVSGAQTLNVHRITGNWSETGVTWTNQPAYNSTADASIAGGSGAGWRIWNVAAVVQGWVSGTNTNYGLLVKCATETGLTAITYTFATRENATSTYRPVLRVNYTPPTSMNCDYVGSGACSVPLPGEAAPGDTYENGQTWSGNVQSWPALSGAAGYNLFRGTQSGLPFLLTSENDSCLRYQGSATSIDLSSDDPSGEGGRFYWYIVVGTNASGDGPAGSGRVVNGSGGCT